MLIDRLDEAICDDDPEQIVDLNLNEEQLINFNY